MVIDEAVEYIIKRLHGMLIGVPPQWNEDDCTAVMLILEDRFKIGEEFSKVVALADETSQSREVLKDEMNKCYRRKITANSRKVAANNIALVVVLLSMIGLWRGWGAPWGLLGFMVAEVVGAVVIILNSLSISRGRKNAEI